MSRELLPEALFSMNALRRAWTLVRRNHPHAGTDGVSLAQFADQSDRELNRLRQQLLNGSYRPAPVRRYFIAKANGKQRPICQWSIRDRVAQRVVHDYLMAEWDGLFLPCNFGFRIGRSVTDAVEAVCAGRDKGLTWVVDADIKDYFGSIPIHLLQAQIDKTNLPTIVTHLIQLWLYTPIERGREVAGVSQGGVISPLLANLYLHRFDEMVSAALPAHQLVRFADDFILLCADEEFATWGLDVARRSLENLRLSLNLHKTRLTTFADGFTFLGYAFKHQSCQRIPKGDDS